MARRTSGSAVTIIIVGTISSVLVLSSVKQEKMILFVASAIYKFWRLFSLFL